MTITELLKMGVLRGAAEAIAARFKLDAPAQIENHIYGIGCNTRSVIEHAQEVFKRTQGVEVTKPKESVDPVVAQAKNAHGWAEVPICVAREFEKDSFAPVRYLYEHPPTKPQRITEQDAREILESYWNSSEDCGDWLNSHDGKLLLDKLNEHREPEVKQGENVYGYSNLIKKLSSVVNWIKKRETESSVISHTVEAAMAALINAHGELINARQVTANKAEVTTIREDLHHLMDGLENLLRNSNDTYDKGYIRGMISKVSEMIVSQPLPPLKDDEI